MSPNTDDRIRVILRWIEIKDSKDLDGEGEFRFKSNVSTGGRTSEQEFPKPPNFYRIEDKPHRNRVDKLDRVLYEGEAGDELVVELSGLEHDRFSPPDPLVVYRRVFTGPVESWIGRHQPIDEGVGDPENLKNWRVCYDIERA